MPFSWKKRKNLIVLAFLIFAQLILISVQVPLGEEENFIEKFVFSVFSPIQHGVVSFFRGIGGVWKSYFDLRRVKQENQSLQQKIYLLKQENQLLWSLLEKYKSEKEIVDVLINMQRNILPARIIGMDASNIWNSVVVNKGSLDGVKKDLVVLDENGQLVGRVVEPVAFREARVQLITDNESGVHVHPEGKETAGVLSGDGAGFCDLEFILSTDTEVSEGDRLITTGVDGIYLPGILTGHVYSVKEDVNLYKIIKVKPAFRIQDTDRVAIILMDVNEIF
jgi:rod shape-determining protein MreC